MYSSNLAIQELIFSPARFYLDFDDVRLYSIYIIKICFNFGKFWTFDSKTRKIYIRIDYIFLKKTQLVCSRTEF